MQIADYLKKNIEDSFKKNIDYYGFFVHQNFSNERACIQGIKDIINKALSAGFYDDIFIDILYPTEECFENFIKNFTKLLDKFKIDLMEVCKKCVTEIIHLHLIEEVCSDVSKTINSMTKDLSLGLLTYKENGDSCDSEEILEIIENLFGSSSITYKLCACAHHFVFECAMKRECDCAGCKQYFFTDEYANFKKDLALLINKWKEFYLKNPLNTR